MFTEWEQEPRARDIQCRFAMTRYDVSTSDYVRGFNRLRPPPLSRISYQCN
jgi:hypothetical protein